MRDYSKMGPRFWTGETGKWLRAQGRDHQLLGIYLFTCPLANMIGLYYLPLPTLIHEVGGIDSEGALKVLRSLSEGGYASFDEPSETVFVVEMAKHQIGETLNPRDNRHKAVVKELEQYRKSPFFNVFLDRYAADFQLADVRRNGEKGKGLARGLQAPSKPGAGAGAGSEGGAGAETERGGAPRNGSHDQPDAVESNGSETESFSGQSSPPEEPSPRKRGAAVERRNGDFESINRDVSKLLASGAYRPGDYSGIAQALHLSTLQAEISVRQLRERGQLPKASAA